LDDVVGIARSIEENAKRQALAAETYAATLKNPARKREILGAADALRSEARQLGDAIRAYLARPKDKALRDRLDRLIQSTRDACNYLTRVSQPTADDMAEFRSQKLAAERRNERGRIEGPVNEAVFQAAQQLDSAVKAKHLDDSPLGKLFAASQSIAADMAALSAFAAQGNKKEMILAARRIADAVKQFVANANKIAAETNDPVLKANILASAQAAGNYAVQLKIVAAVKAASDENDPTAETQLISCAQGLCSAVGTCAFSSESATVKNAARGKRR